MGLFGRGLKSVDASLPDGKWLATSRVLYESRIEGFYGSPETMASGGQEHYRISDYGTAMFFYAKSIDMLHTAYGYAQMAQRQPSAADLPIVDGYTASLALALRLHPEAPVADCVREVTHRLRSIASECDRVGLPPGVYRSGLDAMAQSAPHISLDDVLWTLLKTARREQAMGKTYKSEAAKKMAERPKAKRPQRPSKKFQNKSNTHHGDSLGQSGQQKGRR